MTDRDKMNLNPKKYCIVKLLECEVPMRVIGEVFGVTRQAIEQFSKAGWDKGPKKMECPWTKKYLLRRLYLDTRGDIAVELDVSLPVLDRWITEYKITTKDIPAKSELETQYKKKSLIDMADHYGVATMTVRAWMIKRGIDRRPRGSHHLDAKKVIA